MTRHSYLLSAAAVLAIVFALPANATGETPHEEEPSPERATEYYQDASDAYAAGKFDRAAELLDRAFANDPDLIYRYNQLMAYLGLGDYEAGLALLDDYGAAMRDDGRFDDVEELRLELEQSYEAAREKREQEQREAEETAEKEDEEEVEQADIEPVDVDDASGNTVAWTLLGTGGAAVAGGLFLSSGMLLSDPIDRIEQSRTPEDERQVYAGIDLERQDDLDVLRTHQILSIALLSGGAILGATGTVLLMRGDSAEEPSALRLEPLFDGDRAGAVLLGHF